MANSSPTESTRDEIDLIEVIRALWQQKLLILATGAICTLVAVAYVALVTPVYEARGYVIPPTYNDMMELNYGRGAELNLAAYAIKDVFEVYVRNLEAESARRSAFENVYLPAVSNTEKNGSKDALYARFLQSVTIAPVGADGRNRMAVTVQGKDPVQAAALVKAIIAKAGEEAVPEVISLVERQAKDSGRDITRQIANLRKIESDFREDEIARLQEALAVARKIGLENPPIITSAGNSQLAAFMDGQLAYMRGSKALAAEIQMLSERKSGDSFIRELRPLLIKERFIEDFKINPDRIAVYRLDGWVETPAQPISPRKRLIIALGVLGGGGLGIVLALTRYFVLGRRK